MAFLRGNRRPSSPDTPATPATYLYEMHQHTAGPSACGVDDPIQTVRALKEAGFAGMVLTNHFYHGNSGIRRHQSWEDFVRPYEEAYRLAKAEGERLDFDVLFGMEEGVGGQGKEVLLYGITPDFLYAHPELRDGGDEPTHLQRLYTLVHEAGGLLYQAHPFRVRDYIPRPWEELPAEFLDGVEAYNACNSPVENARAVAMARQKGLAMIAGSDAHTGSQTNRYGLAFSDRLRTEAELAQHLRENTYELYIPDV